MAGSVELNTGARMPLVGLGTWKSNPGEVAAAVQHALEAGYRHIDAAWIYGNEKEVGQGLVAAGIPRGEVFITSKLWNTFHHAADVEDACRDSLANLGVDYLDLYLMHWPVSLKKGAPLPPTADDMDSVPLQETWEALTRLVDRGLTRAVGVSNFSVGKLEILIASGVVPAVNQVEMHPFLQQTELVRFCHEHGIHVTAYAPLGSNDRPPRVKDETDPVLLDDPELAAIAEVEERTPADVLLRWSVQRGVVVIPKSVTSSRIVSNLAACARPLSPESMERLAAMDRKLRFLKGLAWIHPGSEFESVEQLWEE